MPTKLLALLLIFATTIATSAQQTPVLLSKKAEAAKHKVATLSPQDKISVIPLAGDEEFGRYLSRDEGGFTFFDVDQKRNVTLQYTEVKRIKNGYGGYNFLRNGHVDHTKSLIIGGIALAALVVLVAAGAKD